MAVRLEFSAEAERDFGLILDFNVMKRALRAEKREVRARRGANAASP